VRFHRSSPTANNCLLARLEPGYQLETDSLGSNPVLRRLKDNELVRLSRLPHHKQDCSAEQSETPTAVDHHMN